MWQCSIDLPSSALLLQAFRLPTTSSAGKPALSTFIPPHVDSLLLDYQSPRAALGYYPNEVPASAPQRRHLLQVPSPFWSTASTALA